MVCVWMWGHIWISNEFVQAIPFVQTAAATAKNKTHTHKNNDGHSIWIGWLVWCWWQKLANFSHSFDAATLAAELTNTLCVAMQSNATFNAIDEKNLRTTVRIVAVTFYPQHRRWWWFTALNFNYMYFKFFVHLITLAKKKKRRKPFSVICVKKELHRFSFHFNGTVFDANKTKRRVIVKRESGWKQNEAS